MTEESQAQAADVRLGAAETFRFGPYRFEAQERALYRNGSEVQLPPRAMVVLERLLRASGHIVSKDELLELWGDISISEHSLTEAVSLIRKERGATVALAPILAGWGITMFWWFPAIVIAGTLGGWAVWNVVGSELLLDREALRERMQEWDDYLEKWQRDFIGAAGSQEVWASRSEGNAQIPARGVPTLDGRAYVYLNNGLFVRDLATGRTDRIAQRVAPCRAVGGYLPAVSPNGLWVAYDCRNRERSTKELWVVGIDGSNSRHLHSDPSIDRLELGGWSRDGSSIVAFVSRKDGTRDLGLFDVESGSFNVLNTVDRPTGWNASPGNYPSLSPDGASVVYHGVERPGSRTRDLYLIGHDRRERRLTRSPADDYSPLWLPDGSGIFFLSDRAGVTEGWLLPVGSDGRFSDPINLVPSLGDVLLSGFTADGTLFYYRGREQANVYVGEMNFETGQLRSAPEKILHNFDGSNWLGDWSADGRYLVWRTHGAMLEVFHLQTREVTLVPARMERVDSASWSPDDWTIVQGADASGDGAVWQIDRTSGVTMSLLEDRASATNLPWSDSRPSIGLTHPPLSPDGRTLYLVRSLGSALREPNEPVPLVAHDVRTGDVTEIAQLSWNSAGFALSRRAPSGLHDG